MKRTIIILLFCVMPSLAYGIEQVEFTMTLSQKGSGPGQVREPSDIAVDSDGTIFVAEKGNKRIHVMGKDGRTINTWSSRSGRRWKLESPEGIALYKNRVYVTDSYYDQVLIFHKDGKFIDVFGGPGKGPKQFDDPQGICAHRGVVYVADNGNHRVQTFSLDGVYLGSIGKKGKDKGEMREPTDVAVDHRGFIYVSEEGNRRVGIFRPSRKHHRYFYDFLRPISVAVDGEGFFVADAGNYKIKKYNLKEDLILSFGRKGDGRAQFRAIAGLAVDEEGKIFVADSKKSNIQVFSPEKVITMPSESAPSPYSVKWMGRIKANVADVVWHKDRLYATSRDEDALLVIYKNAVRKVIKGRGFDDPYGIAVDAQGFLWIVDSDNDRLVKMDSKGNVISTIGRSGSKEGYFSSPKGIVISDKGFIYVADSGNERVQIFNTKGIYINKIEKISKKKLDEPVDVALDRLGNVYIVDEGAHQVVKYDSSGRFLLVIGGEGERAGKFQDPNSVLILNDEVFVLDSGNNRVQIFTLEGKFLREFCARGNHKGDFVQATSISAKDDTTIFIADPENRRIEKLTILFTPKQPLRPMAQGGAGKIDLRWKENPESFIKYYRVYRSDNNVTFKPIASPGETSFRDTKVKPNITYYYKISAVARHGNESARSLVAEAKAKPLLKKPPLEITVVKMRDIIPRNYKGYERVGIGKIRISNRSNKTLSNVKLAFRAEQFIRKPAKMVIKEIPPRKSVDVDLKPIFLDIKAFTAKDNTSTRADIEAVFSFKGKQKSYSTEHTLKLLPSRRHYTKTQVKRFTNAVEVLDEKVRRSKAQKTVASKIKKELDTTDTVIDKLRKRNLSYGEITVCVYISTETLKSTTDLLAIQKAGQEWHDIMSVFDLDITDVIKTLQGIEKSIVIKKKPKPKPKPKRRRRETQEYIKE